MTTNYFEHQETIAKNLILFIWEKGYSRLSLSKLTSIERPSIDHILSGENADEQVTELNNSFGVDILRITNEEPSMGILQEILFNVP